MAGKGKERADDYGSSDNDAPTDALAFREHLLHKLRAGHAPSHRVTAWCPHTGLIAYPAPLALSPYPQQQEPTASTSLLPLASNNSPSICMTLPHLSSHGDTIPEVSFTLQLPEAPGAVLSSNAGIAGSMIPKEYISHLSFSPDGNSLAVFTSIESDSGTTASRQQEASVRFLLYQRGNEINTWLCTFDWDARRAKANLVAASKAGMQGVNDVRLGSAAILDVRWLQKGSSAGQQGRKRNHDALLDLSGASTLAAVLQSNEVLLIHLPYQAIQPQIFVTPLGSAASSAQDLAGLGTSFSPMPKPTPFGAGSQNGILNGSIPDSLGMNLNSTIPVDPLQNLVNGTASGNTLPGGLPLSLQLGTVDSAASAEGQETRLASIGPCSTKQISNDVPEAPPTLVTELLVAYQESYQPKILRQPALAAEVRGKTLQSDNIGMHLDNPSVENNALVEQVKQQLANSVQDAEQGIANNVHTDAQTVNHNMNFGLPDLQSYSGQGPGFEAGYGDINLSALDELFDSDFGGTGNGIDDGANYNLNSELGGLSSTLNSINEDFASSFPPATEPNGAPSPTKKEPFPASLGNGDGSKTKEQGDGSASLDSNNIGNGTNISDSPSKSMFDGAYGSNSLESRGSSPRKNLASNGLDEDDLLEYLDDQIDGGRVEAMSKIKISQLRIEWTEYGVLNASIMPVSTITSQTACLLETTPARPPSAITHLQFLSDAQSTEASTLVAISYPLALETMEAFSYTQAYSISEESFVLSDAFSSLEGRKADPDAALLAHTLEWVVEPIEIPLIYHHQGERAILDIWERAGKLEGITLDREGSMRLSSLTDASDNKEINHILPQHFPLSVTVSPSSNLALACAFDPCEEASVVVGKPALFVLTSTGPQSPPKIKNETNRETESQSTRSLVDELSFALVNSLLARKSVRDILIVADRMSSTEKTDLLRKSWTVASGLVQGTSVEQTRLLWPLLAVQRQLHSGHAIAILDDIMQLFACLRILQDSKATFRNALQQPATQMQVNETFEGDAIWPIIGHITWMFNLWDRIITSMTSTELDRDWSGASFLIMHPLPRMLQQRLVRLIARFANYMMNLREGTLLSSGPEDGSAAVLDTELAKTVLGDIIVSQRQKTQEWNNMLQGLTNKLGTEWTDDISKGREALLTLQLPPQLERTAREMAFGMKQKLLPLVQTQDVQDKLKVGPAMDKVDVVTSVPFKASTGGFRSCFLCRGSTQLYSESSRSGWERSKKRSCICGGQWVVVA